MTVNIYDPATKCPDVIGWLNAEADASGRAQHREHHHDHHDGGHSRSHVGHTHDVNRHDAEIGLFCLAYDEPLHWEHVAGQVIANISLVIANKALSRRSLEDLVPAVLWAAGKISNRLSNHEPPLTRG